MTTPRPGEFDVNALFDALDTQRRSRRMSWHQVADEISKNSENVHGARPLSPATLSGLRAKAVLEGDGVLGMLTWLHRTPESFLAGGDARSNPAEMLPEPIASRVLRFDTRAIHAALDAQRGERRMTWRQVADEIGSISAASLTRLKRGGRTTFPGVMKIISWLGRPAVTFIQFTDR